MTLFLALEEIGGKSLDLPLSSSYHTYDGTDSVNIVYQDSQYKFMLNCNNQEGAISEIEIMVNNRALDIDVVERDNKNYEIICRHNQCPFDMIYGITEIIVHLEFSNLPEQYLFTPHLAVAINQRYESTMDSIREMLDYIYQKEHALLYRGKTRNSRAFPKQFRNQASKYEEELSAFDAILHALKSNLPYFIKNPKCKTITDVYIDSIEKIRTISCKNLQYIAMHPEQLKPTYNSSGIFINKSMMMPEKTLVDGIKYGFDTFENRTIIAFINTLIHHVVARRKEISSLIYSNSINIIFDEPLKIDYILSTTIIQQYTQIAFANFLESLNKIYSQLINCFIQYQQALPVTVSLLHNVPAPTPVFQEIYHYRNIYEVIVLWYGLSNFEIPKENLLLHFSSADTIYEYYCLLHIYDIFVSLGYTEDYEKRTSHDYYEYYPRNIKVIDENTFYFTNNVELIVLYYQPVIYSASNSNTFNNGITLFRTDRSYFTPDFIIKKISCDGTITYGILDAKWRPRKVLESKESGSLYDLAYKYYYSVVDAQSLTPVRFFWLLQGKDDYQQLQSTYFHHKSALSRQQSEKFRNETGIVRLTPNSGVSELMQIIRSFLAS